VILDCNQFLLSYASLDNTFIENKKSKKRKSRPYRPNRQNRTKEISYTGGRVTDNSETNPIQKSSVES
jgi:hypothetical protein